jgi:DNA-binding MarR family transcriptional regulator
MRFNNSKRKSSRSELSMANAPLRKIEDFLGSSLIFASSIHREIEESALREAVGEELSESQLKLLRLLSLSDTPRLGDVAAFLGVSNAAASKAVDKLVSRMLLRRTEGEHDRRSIRLSLTDPARRLILAYEAALKRRLQEIFGRFSEKELDEAAEILNRFTDRIVNHGKDSGEVCLQCGMYFPARCVRQEAGGSCDYQTRINRRIPEPAGGSTTTP